MNKELIEKLIKSNNDACPAFTYENPLLDRNVSKALSKSLVNILKIATQNTNMNSNLRHSVLENIRKLCQNEPENHLKIDESMTEILTGVFEKKTYAPTTSTSSTDKMLDAFLLRLLMGFDFGPRSPIVVNPEIIQALTNLNNTATYLETVSEDIIHWEGGTNVLKNIWLHHNITDTLSQTTIDDISIKLKPEIERVLLENCLAVLQNDFSDLETWFTSNESLTHLVKICSVSPICYQMCYTILNVVLIITQLDSRLRVFILSFVNHVKLLCSSKTFTILYSIRHSHCAHVLDFDINNIPSPIKEDYIKKLAGPALRAVHKRSENDLLLMLSHFPDWFDIYFDQILNFEDTHNS